MEKMAWLGYLIPELFNEFEEALHGPLKHSFCKEFFPCRAKYSLYRLPRLTGPAFGDEVLDTFCRRKRNCWR